jgi:GH35 family endo-1,4-beta-xylanase
MSAGGTLARRAVLHLPWLLLAACNAAAAPARPPTAAAETVEAGVSSRGPVKLGAAVNQGHLFDAQDPAYGKTFLREFDSLTPEYEMKLDRLLPAEGGYDFSDADRLVGYAEASGKEVRGHALIWHRALPPWMLQRAWTRDELLAFMRSHVEQVMGRYRGRIAEWDVVNEALNDDGTFRSSLWRDVIGPDYVEAAFRFARAADPAARLYYNDYGAEWVNAKSGAALALASRLKGLGLVDGVGFQAHVTARWYPAEDELDANLARFAAAGLDVGITELDVAMSAAAGTADERSRLESEIYGGFARACRRQPACKRFTTWGITDRYTWLSSADVPLLFDAGYAPKPAHAAVQVGLGR